MPSGAVEGRPGAGGGVRAVRDGRADVAGDRRAARHPAGERCLAPATRARAIPFRRGAHRKELVEGVDREGGATMNRPPSDLPERLLAADATEFERQMMQAALMQRPSSAASARMARALGVAVTGVVTSFPAKAQGAEVPVPKVTTAVTGASTVLPWVSVGLLGLVIGGVVVGARARHASAPQPTPAALSAPAQPPPVTTAAMEAPGQVAEPVPARLAAGHRGHLGAAGLA